MRTLGYREVRVNCLIKFITISNIDIVIKPNSHGSAIITGITEENIDKIIEVTNFKDERISIIEVDKDESKIGTDIFSGLISNVEVNKVGTLSEVKIEALTGTYLLDMKKKSRSFQDKDMTYIDVINEVVKGTKYSYPLFNIDNSIKIEKPLIQYMESDWEFIIRISSHLNEVIIPDYLYPVPKFWVGVSNLAEKCEFDDIKFETGINPKYFNQGELDKIYTKRDYFYFNVTSNKNYSIGNKGKFRGETYIIFEKYVSLEAGELLFTYRIGRKANIKTKKTFNDKISGMSILGKVLDTKGELIKVHLDIDKIQDIEKSYWYKWTPSTGNIMYSMPKKGTRISLYMCDNDEQKAKAINCVRRNGSLSKGFDNVSDRGFSTEHGKQLIMHQDTLGFALDSQEVESYIKTSPYKILILDNLWLLFESINTINICAVKKIQITSSIVKIKAKFDIICSEILEIGIAKSSISLFHTTDIVGYYTRLFGTVRYSYSPFLDAPSKGFFDGWKFARNLLASVAVTSLAVAVIWAVAPLPTKFTLTKKIVSSLIGSVAITIGLQLYSDFKSGNQLSTTKYIFKTIGAIICGFLEPKLGSSKCFTEVGEFLGDTTIGFVGNLIGAYSGNGAEYILNKAAIWDEDDMTVKGVHDSTLNYTMGMIPKNIAFAKMKSSQNSGIRAVGNGLGNSESDSSVYYAIQNGPFVAGSSGAKLGITDGMNDGIFNNGELNANNNSIEKKNINELDTWEDVPKASVEQLQNAFNVNDKEEPVYVTADVFAREIEKDLDGLSVDMPWQ